MNFSPFSCPIFLGHPEARGRCSQSERMLYGRDLCRSGGTGKAEAAKLPGAGIGPKPCPGKCAAEKGLLPYSPRTGVRDVHLKGGTTECKSEKRSLARPNKTERRRMAAHLVRRREPRLCRYRE